MLGDLQNPRIIALKGFLFLVIGCVAGGLLWAESPTWRGAVLLALTVWGFCRFYYFAFYVIEHYVDPSYRFAGLLDFARYWLRRPNRPQPPSRPNQAGSSNPPPEDLNSDR